MYTKSNPKIGKSTAILFIDFSSAFDNVDQNILFKILKKQKIKKEYINTLKILYYNTRVNGIPLGQGVPQGFISSPFFFKRYIDTIVQKMDKLCLNQYLFLDDWALLCFGVSQIKRILKKLKELSASINMKLNPDKCGILFLSKKNYNKYEKLVGIPVIKQYEFLGI